MKKIYILGAHSRAQTLAVYLTSLYPQVFVEAYLYTNDELNPKWIQGVPVIKMEEENIFFTDYPLFIGTRGIYHEKLIPEVKKIGFKEIYPLTVELDLKLRDAYLRQYYNSVGREYIKINELALYKGSKQLSNQKAIIYVAKSVFDKELDSPYKLAFYEREIQVGAELTYKRLGRNIYTDNIGDNISEKNKQYCELTALYWIWKNATEDIVGLVHYRRHFILPDKWDMLMEQYKIDVILPLPLYVVPSLEENFKKRHEKQVWDCMMECLKQMYLDDYKEAKDFFQGNLYSPCNMFIMRKPVLDEFCSWLFPILEEVERRIGIIEDSYQNRYPGFLSERLMTYYFQKNRNLYKVVYADKNFLS